MSMDYKVVNPATGATVETFPAISDDELEAVLAKAEKAQREWAELDMSERAKIVHRVADLYDERAEELAEIIGVEMGKRRSEAIGEAKYCAKIYRYYADNAAEFTKDVPLDAPGGKAVMQHKPVGTILGIMPWNFPYYQVARFASPNLMLGNAIVLKHAEICAKSAGVMEEIMLEAGVPEGVFQNIYAKHDQISKVIADDRIAGVSLTGSERAGAAISAQAGKALKKAVLELGGSDPYIVLDSSDVKASAQLAYKTRLFNTGQACNSNKRIIVMDDMYEEFVDELVRLASEATPGDYTSEDPNVYMPLSSRAAAENLYDQILRAKDAGATIRTGGQISDEGAYVSPTVITDIPVGSDIYYEEFFGPVLVAYPVSSDEEALELANNTQFGLGGTVFSEDVERAQKVSDRLDVGMASVNIPKAGAEYLPFGGVKRSGYGRELGPVGMDEFVNKRLYYVAD
ncbi:NAD-dependent succinate-semialdehyde dehydrogenase [Brevibacterium ravenspurgense]|uniref:NAD-dependent succinate-semialdehyde dehydrogenase n=1 Tax=Brevibacterium ravenspurgense TaxID=479117 RepID=UPI001EF2EA8A|nr:NAD-dependent succinate-semialdehyde dehydrogenase [Brevibacterium ravenspurgense]MCG7301223.1 NAD-dependent succinate-semialdehyde dehydrogenase [Brevibacterium ravenspurgense]